MIICPNLSNPDVAREFNELVQATSELAAYHIWSLNNGNAIDKAPNGASSKLFLSLLDYYGGDRVKAIQAKAKTYSKSFLNWFGDWIEDSKNSSKVVDENGEPLVVYHGTSVYFDTFELLREVGFHFGTKSAAESFGFNVRPFYLNIKNLDHYEDNMWFGKKFLQDFVEDGTLTQELADLWEKEAVDYSYKKADTFDPRYYNGILGFSEYINEKIQNLKGREYGVEYVNSSEDRGSISYIVLNPNQVKSVDNRGTFSTNSPLIEKVFWDKHSTNNKETDKNNLETGESKGVLGVNTEQLIVLLGSTMYQANVQETAIKELTLNAFDAVKIAQYLNEIDRGNIDVILNDENRTVTVKDNGIGMTPEVVRKAFFTMGGSYKGDNVPNQLKSGGLGLAKMAFLFSSETIQIRTVHNGLKTEVFTTSAELRKNGYTMKTSNTKEPNGTTVTVKIPESYIDSNGEERSIYFSSYSPFINKPMIGNTDLNFIILHSWGDSKTEKNTSIPEGYIDIGTATSAFGDLLILVTEDKGSSKYVHFDVLISGLYLFSESFESTESRRVLFIINIKPKVGVQSEVYPINNQREGFRPTIGPEVADLTFLLNKINVNFARLSYKNVFNRSLSMDVKDVADVTRTKDVKNDLTLKEVATSIFKTYTDSSNDSNTTKSTQDNTLDLKNVRTERVKSEKERKSSFDASGINIEETHISSVDTSGLNINKPLFHNNTDMEIEEDGQKVLNELGSMMIQLRSLYIQTYPEYSETTPICRFGGPVSKYIKNQFWGISIDKDYGGINVNPTLFPLLAINPFYEIPIREGVDSALMMTEYICHLIEHEFNHNYASGEGAEFTGRFPLTYAEFAGIGKQFNKGWKNKLYLLIDNNLTTFIKYGRLYKQAKNLGESLEENRIVKKELEGESSSLENDGRTIQRNSIGEDVSEVSGILREQARKLRNDLTIEQEQKEGVINTSKMSDDVQRDYELSVTQSVTLFIGNKPDATDSEIIEKEQEAAINWATQRQREIFTETQMHLASAYGLVMQPDGTWVSEDGKLNKVVVEFVNSLGHPGEYLDHELLATAHDVIRVGLMEGDASTFNHELAHHYLHMFWNSKPVQDALKVVYRKSMGDLNTPEGRKNVEEALVDMMTEYSVNDAFLKDIENLPIRTRFWNAFNVMLYKAFGIKNNVNKRALAMLITKSFIVNELLNNNLRKVDIEKYNDVLYQSEYQKRKAKDFATYEIVNKTREDQELIQRIIRTTQSKAKSYELKSAVTRFGSIYNDHEQRIRNRETVRKIKQDLSSIKEARVSLDSTLELSKNASIIKTFIGSAILDVTRAIEMMNNAKANQYRNVYYKESGGVREYRDDNDQYYTNASNNATENKFSFDELLYVREEIISYIKPIMELINTVISNAEELGYKNEDVDEIREMIRGSRFDELMSDLHSLYSKANRTLVYGYVDSEIDDQEYLDDDLKQRLKINTHNWLRQQNNFGDVSWYELYIGIGQHSKSDLVRLIQSRINNMHNEVDDIINEKQAQLRTLFDKAKKATHKKYPSLFGRNFLKLLMQLDRNGLPTGKFVSEVNDGQYQQDFEEYRDKLLFGQNGLETKLQLLVDDDGNHLFVDVDDNIAKLEIDELGYPIVPMINKCEALVKDYLLSIEKWKCEHADRLFTYKYYLQRINTLSLSTLRKIDLLNKDINDIKNTVTDTEPIKDNNGNITGYNKIFRIDRLMPSQQLELLRLNNERMFLGSIYYEDGTLKPDTSEEFLMAMELIKFGRKIRGKITYTTDWESFNRSRDNSLDKDDFDRKFTHWQVKSDYFKQLAKWNLDALKQDYPDLAQFIERVKDLLRQRLVLTQQFRGLAIGEIKWDRLVDESTGRLKAIPMWEQLREIDEEISEYRAEISGTIREILKDKEIRKTFGQKYRINGKAFTDLMYRVMIPENIHIKWDEQMYMYDSIRAKVAQSISSDTSLTYAQIQLRISDEFALMTYHDFLDGVDYPLDIFKTTLAYNKEEGYEQIPIQQFSKVDVLNSSSEYVNSQYDQSSESFEQPRMYDSHGNKLYKDDRYDLVKNVPELKEFLDALQNTMKEAWSWIPYLLKYDNRLGLVGGRTGQILCRFGYGNKAKQFLHNLGTFISREFSVVETDVEFAPEGDVQVRPDGSRIKNLPIRFIKMLDNPEYISSDIMGSTMRVFEMAANYKTRSKEVSALLEILSHVNESNVNSGNSSDKSRLAEVIEGMLDRQIYEKLMFMPYVDEGTLNQSMDKWKYMDWFRKGVISTPKNWIKRIGRLRIAFQLGLLANNFISGVVSFLDPLVSMSIDAVTGKYINIFDLSTGAIELAMDMPQGIRSLGKIKVSSETHALMLLFTLSDSTSESYRDYDKNQIYRFISDGLTMKHFSFGDYTLMALNLYATLNNWRYYKDSTGLENFYPKELFIKHAMDVDGLSYKLAKRLYKEAVTARYAFRLNKSNGKEEIVEKYKDAMSTRTFRLIKRQAKSRSSIYNAIVNREERTALQSNVFTQFLTTVRNFMLVGIAEYFKSWRSYQVTEFDENGNPTEENVRKKITPKEAKNQQRYYKGGYNYETLRNEDGIYSSIISLIFRLGPYLKYMMRAILHPRTIGNRYSKERESYLKLNQLNDLALYGTAKVMLNILAVFGLFLLSGITSTAADDDKDNYGKLFWNLIVLRVLIERLTWLNPTTFFELISSPTATFSDMKRKLRLLDLIFDAFGFNGKHLNDVIQRGNFKGRKRWEYDLANMLSTLGLYNWYTNMPSNIKIPFTDIEIPTFGGGAYTLREKTRYYNKFTPQSIDSFFKSESESEESDSSAAVPF